HARRNGAAIDLQAEEKPVGDEDSLGKEPSSEGLRVGEFCQKCLIRWAVKQILNPCGKGAAGLLAEHRNPPGPGAVRRSVWDPRGRGGSRRAFDHRAGDATQALCARHPPGACDRPRGILEKTAIVLRKRPVAACRAMSSPRWIDRTLRTRGYEMN